MKACRIYQYGPPDSLRLEKVNIPEPGNDEILVKVVAVTVNRTDCAAIRAKPFFMRLVTGLLKPKQQTPGTEFAGVVVKTGDEIRSLTQGDCVFGFNDMGCGAQAEYLVTKEDYVISKPTGISFEQAAASSEGAHYAYNFINKLALQKGQKVLVNGASGAIGSAAVQLLKYYELKVTAVCATAHVDLVKSLGADRVIDYTRTDFTRDQERYDLVFDTVGKSSYFKCRRIMKNGGVYISSDLGFLSQNIFYR